MVSETIKAGCTLNLQRAHLARSLKPLMLPLTQCERECPTFGGEDAESVGICGAGKRVTTPPDEKSCVQQAKEGIAAAAAVTAEKAQQAYQ